MDSFPSILITSSLIAPLSLGEKQPRGGGHEF